MKKEFYSLCLALLVPILSGLITFNGFTQSPFEFYEAPNRWDIGVKASNVQFYGDLPDSENKLAYGFYANSILAPAVGFRFLLNFGEMAGQRKDLTGKDNRNNRKFETKYIDYTIDLNFDLFKIFTGDIENPLSVNGFLGIGYIRYRTKKYSLDDVLIEYVGYTDNGETKDKMGLDFVFPYGLEVGYMVTENIGFDLSFKMYATSTDALDGRDREGTAIDMYHNFSLGVKYKFSL